MRYKLGEQGMTLLELLLALALVAMVGSGLMGVYWTGNNAFERQSARSETQYADRTAMQQIISDIKQATKVVLDNGDLVLTINDATVLYHHDSVNNQLLRNGIPIAENINSIIFSYSAKLVHIKIEATVNGEKYTLRSSASPRTIRPPRISPGKFLATDGTGNIYYSNDGITWNEVPQTPNGMNDVSYNDSILVAVGIDGHINTLIDGVWVPQNSGVTQDLNSITWGEGKFVIVGEQQTILYSADGINWSDKTPVPQGGGSQNNWDFYSVAWGNGIFAAVGDHDKVFISEDGIIWSWNSITNSGNAAYRAIAYGNGIFVMVGDQGKIYTSSDGIQWTPRTSGVSTTLNGVAWGSGVFAVDGDQGVILTSSNGVTWNRVPDSQVECKPGIASRSNVDFKSMYYGSGQFIGVGVETLSDTKVGRSLLSTDGSNWTVYPVASDLDND